MANAYLQQQTPTQRDLSAQAHPPLEQLKELIQLLPSSSKRKEWPLDLKLDTGVYTDSQTILLVVQLLPLLSCKVLPVISSWSNHQAVE